MFDKLDDLLVRFEELLNELGEPGVTDDPAHFQKLMKEQSDLQPIVDAYKEYKKNKETIEDSLSMLESEKDEEMREMLKEELSDAKKRVEELEHELKILLLPKDPNDSKNVIVEIRGGAGGDEAALFAAEIYRMYVKYAESRRWKTEMLSLNENGIGGFKEVTFMIKGEGAYSRLKYESGVHRVQRVPETESGSYSEKSYTHNTDCNTFDNSDIFDLWNRIRSVLSVKTATQYCSTCRNDRSI